ncbi:MAG: hypothetical protein H6835_19220 [Planctomycetes bacterium]|nr:hypothetical protein [Planctomycetota bacterium]
MSRATWSLAGLVGAALCAGGCRSFGPPRAATLAALRPMPLAAALQRDLAADGFGVTLELETPVLTGVFDAVGAVGDAGLRLQLFPDVGGKVLDMTIASDWRVIDAEAGGASYHAEAPLDAAAPHLALLLAALFGELVTPLDAARVRGERLERDGVCLELWPAAGAGSAEAVLGPDGAVVAYRIGLGVFTLTLVADGSFSGRRLAGRISP